MLNLQFGPAPRGLLDPFAPLQLASNPYVLTSDAVRRDTAKQRLAFERVRKAERQYAVQLRKIARAIGDLVHMHETGNAAANQELVVTLQRYSDLIEPWAQRVVQRLLMEVARRDSMAWQRYTRMFGLEVQREINSANIGSVYQQLMQEQVTLIKSLPLQAAERVHELATRAIYESSRAGELSQAILVQGQVSKSRADLIARTETARAASSFMRVRAQAIGAEAYQWLTARDQRVRPLHRKLEGRVFRWDDPPIIGENGERGNPGTIYNCRCIALPVLPPP